MMMKNVMMGMKSLMMDAHLPAILRLASFACLLIQLLADRMFASVMHNHFLQVGHLIGVRLKSVSLQILFITQ